MAAHVSSPCSLAGVARGVHEGPPFTSPFVPLRLVERPQPAYLPRCPQGVRTSPSSTRSLERRAGLPRRLGDQLQDLPTRIIPLVYGDYPEIMKKVARSWLPSFTEEQSKIIHGSSDFIGINYYTSVYVSDRDYNTDIAATFRFSRNDPPSGQDNANPLGVSVSKAHDVIATVIERGPVMRQDVVNKGKTFYEKHQLRANASARIS